jgi:LysM repeat protein
MAGRSPARFLAPLALVAVVIAFLLVINSSLNDTDTSTGSRSESNGQPAASPTGKAKKKKKGPRRYIVKNGDTPTSIAEKTGVPLAEIVRLNPDLDPQTLSPGQRIKLRQ